MNPEPEAAALRNVLRRVKVLLEKFQEETDPHEQGAALIQEAWDAVAAGLERPQTNGKVIDALQQEIRDLRGEAIDAKGLQLDVIKLQGERDALIAERHSSQAYLPTPDEERVLGRLVEYGAIAAWREQLDAHEQEFLDWSLRDAAIAYVTLRFEPEDAERLAGQKLSEIRRTMAHIASMKAGVEAQLKGTDDDQD